MNLPYFYVLLIRFFVLNKKPKSPEPKTAAQNDLFKVFSVCAAKFIRSSVHSHPFYIRNISLICGCFTSFCWGFYRWYRKDAHWSFHRIASKCVSSWEYLKKEWHWGNILPQPITFDLLDGNRNFTECTSASLINFPWNQWKQWKAIEKRVERFSAVRG